MKLAVEYGIEILAETVDVYGMVDSLDL